MEQLTDIRDELQRIILNFAKSKNRQYTEKTLQAKKASTEKLLKKAKDCLDITTDTATALTLKQIYTQIKELAENILSLIENQKQVSMAFDIKTASSLLQPYNGKQLETEAFIESMELLDELTATEHKSIMIKFIKTRMQGKAKLAMTDDLTTVAKIADKLRQKFSTKLSSDALMAQLRSCQQGNRKLSDFAEQIENLSSQLTRAFIAEKVASGEAAEKLAEKFSIQSFINNISNQETALILKASNLTTLPEITTKATTVDTQKPSSVLYFNAKGTTKPGNGFNNSNNYNNFNNLNRQRYNNNRRNFNRNNWSQQQGSQNNVRNSRNPNNYQHRMGNRLENQVRNKARTNRINYCESGEHLDPQPNSQIIRLGETDRTQESPEFTN